MDTEFACWGIILIGLKVGPQMSSHVFWQYHTECLSVQFFVVIQVGRNFIAGS